MDDLCDLASHIEDARSNLRHAVRVGSNLLTPVYGPDECKGRIEWPALEELVDALDRLSRELDALPGAEMEAEMAAEREYQDRADDQAEAQRG